MKLLYFLSGLGWLTLGLDIILRAEHVIPSALCLTFGVINIIRGLNEVGNG